MDYVEILKALNVSKTFVGVKALDNVDLTIQRGEIHCLMGENGSGKSTLIKIIGGVIRADSGSVIIGGRELHGGQAIESIRAGVQIIYQDLSLFPNLTVAENISINQMLETNRHLVDWHSIETVARQALEEIGEEIELSTLVGDLSVAQKQIIAISRALTQNARLIIMDEASSAITKEEVDHLFSIIKKLQQRGIATLFISHKLSEVLEIAENITVIRDGKMVGSYSASEVDNDRLVYLMTGKKLEYLPYRATGGEELLSVSDLCKEGDFSHIDLKLHAGEILGITGLLGSGRTELALSLFGLNPPDSGHVYVRGKEVHIRSPRDAIAERIALLPEDRLNQGIFDTQSIGDNIVITILRSIVNHFGFLLPGLRKQRAEDWVLRLQIKTPSIQHRANTLSGGNQQRVLLAKWLATDPEIFILDGPSIGIDIGSKFGMHETIRSLAEAGMGIIMISDEIQEVLDNCNRILLMARGRIIEEITAPETTNAEQILDIITSRYWEGT